MLVLKLIFRYFAFWWSKSFRRNQSQGICRKQKHLKQSKRQAISTSLILNRQWLWQVTNWKRFYEIIKTLLWSIMKSHRFQSPESNLFFRIIVGYLAFFVVSIVTFGLQHLNGFIILFLYHPSEMSSMILSLA